MTGPPTPPPSSATEIEDAARTSLPPPQAPPAEPATEPQAPPAPSPPVVEEAPQDAPLPPVVKPTQTSYELLFPTIAGLARSGSLTELVEVAERADLSVRSVLASPNVLCRLKGHLSTGGE